LNDITMYLYEDILCTFLKTVNVHFEGIK